MRRVLLLTPVAALACASAPAPSTQTPAVVSVPGAAASGSPPSPPVVELKIDDVPLPHGSYPRLHHPDAAVDAQLGKLVHAITADRLGDREGSCTGWATTRLASVFCSQTNTDRMDPNAPPDQGGGAPNPTGWSATYILEGGKVRQASLRDVLAPGKTTKDFVAACRPTIDKGGFEQDPCAFPALTFDLSPGGLRFCTGTWPCHTIEQDAIGALLDPAIARELGWQ